MPIKIIRLATKEEANNAPTPWVINSVFYNGSFVTHKIKPDRELDIVLNKAVSNNKT